MAGRRRSVRLGEEDPVKLSYGGIKCIVERELTADLLEEWKGILLDEPKIKRLWGSQQMSGFERKVITLCVYKDLVGIGYDKVLSTTDLGFNINSKSLQHNHKLIRKLLQSWANTHIKNEGVDVWNAAAENFPKKKNFVASQPLTRIKKNRVKSKKIRIIRF